MGLLTGLRVIDLSRVLSGPYCTALLADLGAEVIKIEAPGGDDARHFGPFLEGTSVYFSMINRNKKSLALNLRDERAQAIVAELAATADVVVENFRPGVAKRLHVDAGTLRALHPRLVYLSISGFGQHGPATGLPAYDLIIQGMSGLMSLTGDPAGPPTATGESISDLWTGLFGSWAVLAALQARNRTGTGETIDLAMFDAMMSLQMTGLSQLRATGRAPGRVGNRHPVTVPVDCFAARDGHLTLVVPTDALFAQLCEAMDRPALAADPRFAEGASRRTHQAELRALIADWLSGLTVDEAVARCQAHDIPAGPVHDLGQAMASEQVRARGVETRVPHPVFGEIGIVPQPARFAGGGTAQVVREPRVGEHGDALLREILGRSDEDIAALRGAGVLA
ncbi:CoA transferase [Variovorax sp. WS11]|uniref:CaiB/BaiF CoA transferase family protein n=1 Tax=Variovorax sp. WS11 TaxID=1105204 RepID=UPI000D0D03FA|nr:CoA transferase [Variovorax sp. WS11]NDZ16903.1 CoA transferase [Variovorax sp. WS11]PSL86264.1 CoA transferase [Variovorax sp. WS11]